MSEDDTKTGKYVVGCNMPGYMPDSEPWFCNNWRVARDAFLEECQQAIDADDYEDERTHYKVEQAAILRMAKLRKRQELSLMVGGYRYWLEFAV